MKNLSSTAKIYILGMILLGLGLIAWTAGRLDWLNPWLYQVSLLGAVFQTLKVEGPNSRTNYSLAWFVYGFAFIAFGVEAAIFVILVSHLVEWIWHRYPWFIQGFNISNHVLAVFLGGLVFGVVSRATETFDLVRALGLAAANLIFVFGNHFLVGLVVKLARAQSFAQSGVFELLPLSLDFTVLTLGAFTALALAQNPLLSLLNIPLLYPLYHALRLPALIRQLKEVKIQTVQAVPGSGGD